MPDGRGGRGAIHADHADRAAHDVVVCDLVAQMCRALGDVTRLRIVRALDGGPLSVGDLSRVLDMPQPSISRHLKVLRDQAVVVATRHAQTVEYRLGDPGVVAALDMLRHVIAGTVVRRTTTLTEAFGGDATDAGPVV